MNMITKKMKRKDLELDEFSDEFSDFSLSSPARKIRRLDAELPPIMEEEEVEIPPEVGGGVTEDLELPSNEERAIVLFKPVNASLFGSQPSNLSISVDSRIISGFKNQLFGSSQYGHVKSADEEEAMRDKNGDCLAVVPWVPSQFPPAPATEIYPMDAPELMEEAEEMEATTMDVEEDNNNSNASMEQGHPNVHAYGGVAGSDGFHQWQQQYHCMIPQIPQNTSTPITWFR